MFLQDKLIDYTLLGKACEYYSNSGFKQVEVPWIVNRFYMELTCPFPGVGYAMGLDDGDSYLVCSAEQGFIRQAILGELPKRRALFAVSPCFRDEEHDETHSKYFMKLELFRLGNEKESRSRAKSFADMALNLYTTLGVKDARIEDTEIGMDIMSGDLELGSYGVRNLMGDEWCAYGTGIALPRLSLALERQQNTPIINGKPRLRGKDWVQG